MREVRREKREDGNRRFRCHAAARAKTACFVGLFACVTLWHTGCKSGDEVDRTILLLQQGNFSGHIAIAGSPAAVVDFGTRIKVGADATVTADGSVDFSRPAGSGNAEGGMGKAEAADAPPDPSGP